jgi:predicted component of type VI protein secretion system
MQSSMFPEAAGDWPVDDVGRHLVAVAFAVRVQVGAFFAPDFGFAGEVAEDGAEVSHSDRSLPMWPQTRNR